MLTKKCQKNAEKFYCEKCDFRCSKESNYNKHLLTHKHKMLTNVDEKMPKIPNEFICECGKSYKYRQSLHVHKKKCKTESLSIMNSENKIDANLVLELIKQNRELQQQLISTNTINNNTTNNNNQKFNINVFLNETCKDAINFSDFIENIQVSHDDLENNARLGFVDGMTKIIRENLQQYTLHERPIHCTDVKRDKMYIRDENKWEKEQEIVQKTIHNGIRELSIKSMGSLNDWKQDNPEYDDVESDFSNKCILIQKETLSLGAPEKYSKVTHNLAKESKI